MNSWEEKELALDEDENGIMVEMYLLFFCD
jgi:hypothetical protein